jgi:hypothetical protein
MNEKEAARSVLAEGTTLFHKESRRFKGPAYSGGWHDWLICKSLLAEANGVVLPAPAP